MAILNILLDLDGTLTDPKEGIVRCIRYGLEQVGYQLADDISLDWCIGPPLKASLAQLMGCDDEHLAEQALMNYRERFSKLGLFENVIYPHVTQTLSQLQHDGYRLYLATAKPTIYAQRILQHFKIDHYFTAIYGSELDGTRTVKTELLDYILQRENLSAQQCVMVGDRMHDIQAAKAHAMRSIAVNYGYGSAQELEQAQPDLILENFNQLIDYIKLLNT